MAVVVPTPLVVTGTPPTDVVAGFVCPLAGAFALKSGRIAVRTEPSVRVKLS